MKKIFFLLLCLFNLAANSQTTKWFFSLNPGFSAGGPICSIKNQIVRQGFNQTSSFSLFDLDFSTKFPRVERGGSFLVRAGKKISPYKSVYLTAGIAGSGEVTGFKSNGTYSYFFFFGGSNGEWLTCKYKILQFAAGYEYSFAHTRAKLGISPAIYLLRYCVSPNFSMFNNRTSVVPGISGMARLPLGKEKRLVGVDLITEASLAPPAKMKASKEAGSSFQPGAVNMIHFTAGLALSFRKK